MISMLLAALLVWGIVPEQAAVSVAGMGSEKEIVLEERAAGKLEAPKIAWFTGSGRSSVKVWLYKKVKGADGYDLYWSKNKNGPYYKVFMGKRGDKRICIKKPQAGQSIYMYAIAYKKVGTKKIYGKKSRTAAYTPGKKPEYLRNTGMKVDKSKYMLTFTWAVDNAEKVQIERKEDNGKYKIWMTVDASKRKASASYNKNGFRRGHEYKFRMRAYNSVDGKKYYSRYVNLPGISIGKKN